MTYRTVLERGAPALPAATAAIRRAAAESSVPSFQTIRSRRERSRPGTWISASVPRARSSATVSRDSTATAPPYCTAVLSDAVEPR